MKGFPEYKHWQGQRFYLYDTYDDKQTAERRKRILNKIGEQHCRRVSQKEGRRRKHALYCRPKTFIETESKLLKAMM